MSTGVAIAGATPAMSTAGTDGRTRTRPAIGSRQLPRLSRITIGALAVTLAFADGIVFTGLQGAVGSIQRTKQEPALRWARDAMVMLPVYALAVTAALLLTRRLVRHRRELVQVLTVVALTIGLGTAVGVAELTVSAYVDYQLQSDHLEEMHSGHQVIGACVGLCAAKHDTLQAHVRGVSMATVVLVIVNSVLVLWVLALRGGQLWTLPRRGRVRLRE